MTSMSMAAAPQNSAARRTAKSSVCPARKLDCTAPAEQTARAMRAGRSISQLSAR